MNTPWRPDLTAVAEPAVTEYWVGSLNTGQTRGRGIQHGFTSCAFSGSGAMVIAGSDDCNIYAWETLSVGNHEPIWNLRKHSNRVSCIKVRAFSHICRIADSELGTTCLCRWPPTAKSLCLVAGTIWACCGLKFGRARWLFVSGPCRALTMSASKANKNDSACDMHRSQIGLL
jgi:hypothetical protein